MVYRKRAYKTRRKNKYVTVPQVKSLIHKNMENKMNYGRLIDSFASIGNEWVEHNVTDISQGVGLNERIGNQIKIRSLEIKGVIAQGSNESLLDDPWNVVRIVIARWDGQHDTPLGTDEWDMDYALRYGLAPEGDQMTKKLYDKYISLNVTSTEKGEGDGYAPSVRQFKYYKKFKNPLIVQWGSNSSNPARGRIIVSMMSDSTAIPHPGFVNGYWVLTYEDA